VNRRRFTGLLAGGAATFLGWVTGVKWPERSLAAGQPGFEMLLSPLDIPSGTFPPGSLLPTLETLTEGQMSNTIGRNCTLAEAAHSARATLYKPVLSDAFRVGPTTLVGHVSGQLFEARTSYDVYDLERQRWVPAVTTVFMPRFLRPQPAFPGIDASGKQVPPESVTYLPGEGIVYPARDKRVAKWITRDGLHILEADELVAPGVFQIATGSLMPVVP